MAKPNSSINKTLAPSFLLSGETDEEESKKISKMIKYLGGKVLTCKKDQFVNLCSHIVCFSFDSTVKIMAGLASGKWLVEKKYILDSYEDGKWLAEESYEVKDHNQVARFRRLEKIKNGKLFAGLICYIETENSTKWFIRVLLSGGATVLNKMECLRQQSKVQYAISDIKSLNSVLDVVKPTTPILKLDFIKNTIFFKHNPKDKRRYLMNSNTAVLPDEPYVEPEDLSVVATIPASRNETPAKPRVRRRMQLQSGFSSKHRYPSIASYFLKKGLYAPVGEAQKTGKMDYCYTDDDVKFIEEVKSSKPADAECLTLEDLPEDITADSTLDSTPKRGSIDGVLDSIDAESTLELLRKRSSSGGVLGSTEAGSTPELLRKRSSSDGVLGSTEAGSTPESPRKGSSSAVVLGSTEADTTQESTQKKSIASGALPSTEALPVNRSTLKLKSFGTTPPCSNSVLQEMDTNTSEKNLKKKMEVKEIEIFARDSTNENKTVTSSLSSRSTFRQNRDRLLKHGRAAVVVDRKRLRDIAWKYVIELNTSHHFLSSSHIPAYSYPTSGAKVYELEDKEYLNAVSVGDGDNITQKKVGRHKIHVVSERQPNERSEEEEDLTLGLDTLEWLQLKLKTNGIPNASSTASMIKYHVMQTSFRDVSNKSLCILKSLLYLHPPCNKQMRDYYIAVFHQSVKGSATMQASNSSPSPNHPAWEFVKAVANDLLSDAATVSYDAGVLMGFVTELLELELIHYNEKPVRVEVLVSYRLFWPDPNQNPSVTNSRVKDMVALWVRSANALSRHRRKITKLMSVMLEMVWKWSEMRNPFILRTWPLPKSWEAITNVIALQFKGVEDCSTLLPLIESLRVPWQQMLVTSLALRSIHSLFVLLKPSLPELKCCIANEVKSCKSSDDHSEPACASHPLRVKFLALMYVSYAHGLGIHYTKAALNRQFCRTLSREDVLHTHKPASPSESLGAKRRKVSTSPAADERDSEGDEDGESEWNDAIEEMVNELSVAFTWMNPVRKEIHALKSDCLHVAQSPFLCS